MSTYVFELSHDELAWLLLQMKIPPRLGMGETLYPRGSDPAVVEARLEAGAAALTARGWVDLTEADQVSIGDVPLAALGATALAQTAALATVQEGDDQTVYGCYLSENLLVEHRLPVLGVHRFTMVNTWDEFSPLILDHLGLVDIYPANCPEVALSVEGFNALLTEVEARNGEAVHRQLRQAGVENRGSTEISDLLTHWSSRIVMNMLGAQRQPDETTQLASLGNIMVFKNGAEAVCFYLLLGETGALDVLGMKPYSPEAAREDLERLAYSLPFLGG